MRITRIFIVLGMWVGPILSGEAAVLTFDFYTDAGKLTKVGDIGGSGFAIPEGYGDHITTYTPTGSYNSASTPADANRPTMYVNYGSTGGLTPNIGVTYRMVHKDGLNSTHPADNFATSAAVGINYWRTGYGSLDGVAIDHSAFQRYAEIRFTPDPGYAVTLVSFRVDDYFSGVSGSATLWAIQNINSPSTSTLWSDTFINGSLATTYSPNVTVNAGDSLSFAWGLNEGFGIDEVTFSQTLLPEPASVMLLLLGGACLSRRGSAAGMPQRRSA